MYLCHFAILGLPNYWIPRYVVFGYRNISENGLRGARYH